MTKTMEKLPRIIRRVKIHGVPCDINVFVNFQEALALATEYIEWRLARPIIVWPGRLSPNLQIGFPAHISKDKEILESGAPYIPVKFNGNKGRIYAMYGASLDEVTEDYIKLARRFYLDKVFIERDDDDGHMWLDF